jgi:pyrroloquinoline quinone biosynthesis protein B
MLRIIVLGAAAGGGFPQWNSLGPNCARARAGDPATPSLTQASLAVSANGDDWFLLDAAPELRIQIERTPELHPRVAPRHSPIKGVVLTSADVDRIAGLLTLREGQPLSLYATPKVHAVLDANPVFEVLNREKVARLPLALGTPLNLVPPSGEPSLEVTAFGVPGKVPLWLEGGGPVATDLVGEDVIGLEVRAVGGGPKLVYMPGCAAITPEVMARAAEADVLMLDGTLWTDDELVAAGIAPKTGRRMGHVSMSGPDGSIAALAGITRPRRYFIHINNSNPVLAEDAPERRVLEAAGWRVARDGMIIDL